MIASKKLSAIVAVLLCACLVFCGVIVYAAHVVESKNVPEYQSRLFGDEILTIDIQTDADDWRGLQSNAQAKEWISGDLTINGERFGAVGLRTKGNSSLSMGRMGGAGNTGSNGDQRYSLQFKFNKYVKGQTCYGLDTLCINNMMGDATYMKDYMAYEIMDYIGVAAPLHNYAKVTVNGEDYGFFVALERYDKAFLDRVYNTSGGELYSVKIAMGQREDFEGDFQENFVRREPAERPQGGEALQGGQRPQEGGMMGGGFGGRGGGGSLVYTGDEISSYSSIFDNAVFNSSDKDKQRVIEAIKHLNAGTNLEQYIDVDQTLRYFAAHTVTVNGDSYTSNMQQNYYLYERNGKLTILPWDYGLAFGGFMSSGGASGVVNFPIDTPVSGVSLEDRPLIGKLLEVDEYRERYHEYLRDIAEGYLQGGLWESTIKSLDEKISEHVKNDATALFTYEQYQAALPVFTELGLARAESILGQLEGTIPSTSEGQRAEGAALVDSSGLNMSALGSMGGGGGDRGQGGNRGQGGGRNQPDQQNEQPGDMPGGFGNMPGGFGGDMPGGFGGGPGFGGGNMPDMGVMQEAQQLMASGGELTEELKEQLLALGITEEQIEIFASMQDRMGGPKGGKAVPGGNRPGGTGNPATTAFMTSTSYAIVLGVLLLLLAGMMIFIAKPRKNMI